jgi:hypothetical protein
VKGNWERVGILWAEGNMDMGGRARTGNPFAMGQRRGYRRVMSKILVLAIFLLILWVVLRVALAVTGVFLHLLWIFAIILAVMWLIGKLRGKS